MNPPAPDRTVQDSLVQMTEIVLPEDSNPHGSIFGGRVLALIDKCAAIVAIRHARSEVRTVGMDSVVFLNEVRVGNVLLLRGRLNSTFRSSMEVEVEVRSEDPLTGRRMLTTCAFVTMVSVDASGSPHGAPALVPTSEAERQRAASANERRRGRLAARKKLATASDW